MTEDLLASLQAPLTGARAALADGNPVAGLRLLRQAEPAYG